jgi:phage/plasmid-like protein (TIGR03299 family)
MVPGPEEIKMSANLATKINGQAALWLNGKPAWHHLGKVWTEADGEITLDRLLAEAGLDFEVEKRPMFFGATDESKMGTSLVTEGQNWAIVRNDTQQQLGTVGNVYRPFQNHEAFGFLFDVTGQGVATVESAGLLANGSRVFVSLQMGEDIVLDPKGSADKIRKYVFATTAHNGMGKISGGVTPTRIVCTNTFQAAIGNASYRWDIRHTEGGIDRLRAAADTVKKASEYYTELEQVGTELLHAKMTKAQFHKFVAEAFPIDPKSPQYAQDRVTQMRDKMIYLFEEAKTNENIRHTRWAGLQAVTEYIDHFSEVRVPKSLLLPGDTPEDLKKDMARGARIVKGEDAEKKTQVAKKLLTWKR